MIILNRLVFTSFLVCTLTCACGTYSHHFMTDPECQTAAIKNIALAVFFINPDPLEPHGDICLGPHCGPRCSVGTPSIFSVEYFVHSDYVADRTLPAHYGSVAMIANDPTHYISYTTSGTVTIRNVRGGHVYGITCFYVNKTSCNEIQFRAFDFGEYDQKLLEGIRTHNNFKLNIDEIYNVARTMSVYDILK